MWAGGGGKGKEREEKRLVLEREELVGKREEETIESTATEARKK